MSSKLETIEHIPLAAITADASWNARSGRWTDDMDSETGDGFEGLKESIEACGVKEPVKIRPIEGGERPYALVSGFRRYAASLQLNLPTIPAVVREMTEAEARLENTRENAVRKELKTPDLAWAIAQMVAQGMTDTAIARGIGRSCVFRRDPISVPTAFDQRSESIRSGFRSIRSGFRSSDHGRPSG